MFQSLSLSRTYFLLLLAPWATGEIVYCLLSINSRVTLIDCVSYLLAYGETIKTTACASYSSAAIIRISTVLACFAAGSLIKSLCSTRCDLSKTYYYIFLNINYLSLNNNVIYFYSFFKSLRISLNLTHSHSA